ncbi:MAG: ABC transporter permease, partial [Rhodobacteraceae bacterium]|nr:ABC transporter permease [Paracoccaceae bacterium]
MTLVILSLMFWAGAWWLNVGLSQSDVVRSRAGRLLVPALFGITLLVVWEGMVRGLNVPGVILPPPSA